MNSNSASHVRAKTLIETSTPHIMKDIVKPTHVAYTLKCNQGSNGLRIFHIPNLLRSKILNTISNAEIYPRCLRNKNP